VFVLLYLIERNRLVLSHRFAKGL